MSKNIIKTVAPTGAILSQSQKTINMPLFMKKALDRYARKIAKPMTKANSSEVVRDGLLLLAAKEPMFQELLDEEEANAAREKQKEVA